ncbi:P2Y purinoceptor 13-like [Engraulis encrasicolus]|uniref:P2Y purinoceptor 13-like n=1 Tax=Engraulis encrasicolus TaxID=184585 RepID=UPI002FD78342
MDSSGISVMASTFARLDCGIDIRTCNFVVVGCFYVLFFPALLLNTMAAWISWNINTKSSFVVYLKNLVAADLLMTLIIPVAASDLLPWSPRGLRSFNCQFGRVLFYLCMYVSIILMGVISLDRFFKIVQPGGKRLGHSVLFGRLVSAGIWIVLISINAVPTMVLTNKTPGNDTAELCMAMKDDVGKRYHQVVIMVCNAIFFIVLIVIAFCYMCIAKRVIESYRNSGSTNAKGKRKIKARVFIVLVVFLVCFAPYHITRLLYIPQQVKNRINCQWASLRVAKDITLWLATTNVCLDPLIYFLLCKAFRVKLFQLKIFSHHFSTSTFQSTDDTSL